jgi:hypothetical protein
MDCYDGDSDTESYQLMGFRPVVLGSFLTIVGTLLLCHLWMRRKRVPSYGTLFGIPIICACLIRIGPMFWDGCRYGAWGSFTPAYWREALGGFTSLYFPVVLVGATCILPSAAIVVYYQGRYKELRQTCGNYAVRRRTSQQRGNRSSFPEDCRPRQARCPRGSFWALLFRSRRMAIHVLLRTQTGETLEPWKSAK